CFGSLHIVNTLWESLGSTGVNCRMDAQVQIQSSAFSDSPSRAVFFADSPQTGYAILDEGDLDGPADSGPKSMHAHAAVAAVRADRGDRLYRYC
ncbi:hypothetical protein AAE478_006248, partial [Parahypoxylon ruwenzoriense]